MGKYVGRQTLIFCSSSPSSPEARAQLQTHVPEHEAGQKMHGRSACTKLSHRILLRTRQKFSVYVSQQLGADL
jgi:hypothetical protein